ncbi:hypothetical protein J8281_06715 [Aquimarina sp. U1-2]|uniref:hypothetical protein n=1 Tax=Aquimarina sp. U1-2 TaxID=2823141 RepID=UPI001AEC9761|nr:hypothetical protein [Aquimarina sp. U1-2]MBP2831876.1 hypothetical protein [Aquimarina sp. U1-2]
MQRFITILLLMTLHLQTAVNISVWVDFLVNNEYIKEILCVNKEKPKLSCNGKCYLMHQLQEQQSEQEQELPQLIHSKFEFAFFSFREIEINSKRILRSKKSFPLILSHYSHLKYWEIFHPPCA